MKTNLEKAMEMEKEYRKLQTDHKAKTEFGYNEKLKEFGFNNTAEYERAKDEHYLKTSNIQILEIVSTEFPNLIMPAILNRQETLWIGKPPSLMVWVGTDDYNKEYCIQNNIPIVPAGYIGGTIVSGIEDFAMAILTKNGSIRQTLSDMIYEEIAQYFPTAERNRHDILINGNKVFGIGIKDDIGNNMDFAAYQFTFKAYPEEISIICKKEMKKPPMGMLELGEINRESLIEKIKSWINQ